jgi:hypothetical protein
MNWLELGNQLTYNKDVSNGEVMPNDSTDKLQSQNKRKAILKALKTGKLDNYKDMVAFL